MKYVDVELSSGEKVRVYPSPGLKVSQLAEEKFPTPLAPVRESKTVTGDTIKMSIDDDPDYLREKARVDVLQADEIGSLTMLFCLKDVKVPADFDMEAVTEIVCFSKPDWQPREGTVGRKLDYLEWVLLANPADRLKIQEALAELSGINLDAVKATEDSFRDNVAGETPRVLAEPRRKQTRRRRT